MAAKITIPKGGLGSLKYLANPRIPRAANTISSANISLKRLSIGVISCAIIDQKLVTGKPQDFP